MQGPRRVIFFDGACATCNRSLTFLAARLQRDTEFAFVALESPLAEAMLSGQAGITGRDAVIYMDDSEVLQGAAAIERALSFIPRWRVLGQLLALLPDAVTEAAYDAFASQRHRWNQRLKVCEIPSAQLQARLLT